MPSTVAKSAKRVKPAASRKAVVPKAAAKKAASLKKSASDKDTVTMTVTLSEPSEAALPKQKLVRDSFTMPRDDFDLIDVLKARALVFHRPAKKSELLRAGLHALSSLSDAQLRKGLEALVPLKAGRPKNAQ